MDCTKLQNGFRRAWANVTLEKEEQIVARVIVLYRPEVVTQEMLHEAIAAAQTILADEIVDSLCEKEQA